MTRSQHVKKGKWTLGEDHLLRQSVTLHGKKAWSKIAKLVGTRDGKQCRDRYCNHLDPDVIKAPWTAEEDMMLLDIHSKLGNKWAEIAKCFPGRTDNAVKNRWHSTIRPSRLRGKPGKFNRDGRNNRTPIKRKYSSNSTSRDSPRVENSRMKLFERENARKQQVIGHDSNLRISVPSAIDGTDDNDTAHLRNNQMTSMWVHSQIGDGTNRGGSQKKGPCNCKKSRCIKLYCDCFTAGQLCQGCNCIDCCNLVTSSPIRQQAIETILQRNALAFDSDQQKAMKNNSVVTTKGCHCKKSACKKKYCECFQRAKLCTSFCQCHGCENNASSSMPASTATIVPPLMATPTKGRPKLGRPKLGRQKLGRPKLGRPKLGRPKLGRQKLGRPKLGRPKLGRPKLGRPKLGRPKLGRPRKEIPKKDLPEKEVQKKVLLTKEFPTNDLGTKDLLTKDRRTEATAAIVLSALSTPPRKRSRLTIQPNIQQYQYPSTASDHQHHATRYLPNKLLPLREAVSPTRILLRAARALESRYSQTMSYQYPHMSPVEQQRPHAQFTKFVNSGTMHYGSPCPNPLPIKARPVASAQSFVDVIKSRRNIFATQNSANTSRFVIA